MNIKFKKVSLVVMILMISILLNGCVNKREIAEKAVDIYFEAYFNSLDFIKTHNYSGEDITELEYVKADKIKTIKLVFKEDIVVSNSFDFNKITSEFKITAKKKSNIEDLINCANYMFNYDDSKDNYSIFKDSINEALKNEGQKIEIPLSKSNNIKRETYVQVLDDTIYIVIRYF